MQFFNCKSNLCWSYNSYIIGNLFVQYSKLAIIIVYLVCAMMYIEHDLEFDCKVFVKILVGRTSCAPSYGQYRGARPRPEGPQYLDHLS
jgi:hypothetical protein